MVYLDYDKLVLALESGASDMTILGFYYKLYQLRQVFRFLYLKNLKLPLVYIKIEKNPRKKCFFRENIFLTEDFFFISNVVIHYDA